MKNKELCLPSYSEIREHGVSALQSYWPSRTELIAQLPVLENQINISAGEPLKLKSIRLPDWAGHCGVDQCLLVPLESVPPDYVGPEADLWREIDWFLAVFLLIECWHERLWENKFGPIHSYSFRLKGWDKRAWQHAWVNRIGLFLREWAAHLENDTAESRFGPLPTTKIHMTHDVDAISKTWAIRIKQSGFFFFNAIRSTCQGDIRVAAERLGKAFIFFFGYKNWMVFDILLAEEKQAEITGTFHFYADLRSKSIKRWLLDPGYKVNSVIVRKLLTKLVNSGHKIGLHPGFDSWDNPEALVAQKSSLEAASGVTISSVRQHWLRFSWAKTWVSQESAGLTLDTTLMFNDKPGFRNSSLLCWHPWNSIIGESFNLQALPSMLMDSHFYDYLELSDVGRKEEMNLWVKECMAVSGEVAVLWHPHTLSNDYGWSSGFSELLKLIKVSGRKS